MNWWLALKERICNPEREHCSCMFPTEGWIHASRRIVEIQAELKTLKAAQDSLIDCVNCLLAEIRESRNDRNNTDGTTGKSAKKSSKTIPKSVRRPAKDSDAEL